MPFFIVFHAGTGFTGIARGSRVPARPGMWGERVCKTASRARLARKMKRAGMQEGLACPLAQKNEASGNARVSRVPAWAEKRSERVCKKVSRAHSAEKVK
jgi:hypothetical protein